MVGIQWNEFVGNNWRNVGLILKLNSNPPEFYFLECSIYGYQPIDFQILRSKRRKKRKNKNKPPEDASLGPLGWQWFATKGWRPFKRARKNVAPPQPYRLRFGRHSGKSCLARAQASGKRETTERASNRRAEP